MDERRKNQRPDDWLEVTLHRMEETEARHHREIWLRLDAVMKKLDEHEEHDHRRFEDHSERILVMETERKGEKESERRMAGIQSTIIGALLITGWEVMKRQLLGWK